MTVTVAGVLPVFMMPSPVDHPSGPALSTSGRLAALVPPVKVLYEVDSVPPGATSLTMAASVTPEVDEVRVAVYAPAVDRSASWSTPK